MFSREICLFDSDDLYNLGKNIFGEYCLNSNTIADACIDSRGILIEENNIIVGYIIYGLNLNIKTNLQVDTIYCVCVKKEYRKKGFGEYLVKSVLKNVLGRKNWYLNVRISNTNAINLYKKLGFNVEYVIKNYYDDGEDAYFMKY